MIKIMKKCQKTSWERLLTRSMPYYYLHYGAKNKAILLNSGAKNIENILPLSEISYTNFT